VKIITLPQVHLLAEPVFHPHPLYEIPVYSTAAEAITAHAGKGCYDSYGLDGRSVYEHVMSLIKSYHGSVLEHANFTLFITGVSRGLSHELVRHRAGFAYSQRSTRYTAEEDAAIVLDSTYARLYRPDKDLAGQEFFVQRFLESCARSINDYTEQVALLMARAPADMEKRDKRKWARGKARQLLPHALETRLTMTGNIRAWRHFFEQRSSRWAEEEIRRLAVHVWSVLAPRMGCTVGDYSFTTINNIDELSSPYRKV
jgi:thymidylate synthase (FAD)